MLAVENKPSRRALAFVGERSTTRTKCLQLLELWDWGWWPGHKAHSWTGPCRGISPFMTDRDVIHDASHMLEETSPVKKGAELQSNVFLHWMEGDMLKIKREFSCYGPFIPPCFWDCKLAACSIHPLSHLYHKQIRASTTLAKEQTSNWKIKCSTACK